MGGEITGDCNQNMTAFIGITPNAELPHSRLQHLVGMEAGVFTQQRVREYGDQRLWRMAEHEMARYEPGREVDLPLPIKGIE